MILCTGVTGRHFLHRLNLLLLLASRRGSRGDSMDPGDSHWGWTLQNTRMLIQEAHTRSLYKKCIYRGVTFPHCTSIEKPHINHAFYVHEPPFRSNIHSPDGTAPTSSVTSVSWGGAGMWSFLRKYILMNLLFSTASVLLWAFLASAGLENWTRAPSGSPS